MRRVSWRGPAGALRAKRRYMGIFSACTVSLQAAAMLARAGINRYRGHRGGRLSPSCFSRDKNWTQDRSPLLLEGPSSSELGQYETASILAYLVRPSVLEPCCCPSRICLKHADSRFSRVDRPAPRECERRNCFSYELGIICCSSAQAMTWIRPFVRVAEVRQNLARTPLGSSLAALVQDSSSLSMRSRVQST